ncbi:MerR family transcriptional regulator [Trinickia symbiotica]|uniref:MerR family transcriptional regulator n=1 Tax=Trinickia symbiotica TaxID=863227 RepID=A0A2T3XMC3_9BURK|nr:MerR family transcriptional regulator [Trinickia symbiotica]PTB17668.1 MerR family transcriptional regulator [Trinickia symbiotica]
MSEALTIGRMAAALGVSTHTLRYYEQAGLIQPVSRTSAGHRLYARDDIEWLRFVMRLKATGMPIAGMQEFAALRARGEKTVGKRLALLVEHRAAVLGELRQLEANLAVIDEKIAHYERLAQDMTDRRSTPQPHDKELRWHKQTIDPTTNATPEDGPS